MTALHLYVYYPVGPADVDAALSAVKAMQAGLVAATSVRARLQRRTDAAGDRDQTWMEVYPDVPVDFEERLVAAVASAGLDTLCGSRHVERFEDLA